MFCLTHVFQMYLCMSPAPCIPVNILCKFFADTNLKSIPCKGKIRESVKCPADIQTHMSTVFSLSTGLVILSKEKMS